MHLKIGDLTFDAKPIQMGDMPGMQRDALYRSKTKVVRNYYDCRDGGTFGKKKRLKIHGNVIASFYGSTKKWDISGLGFTGPSTEELEDTAAASTGLFNWMRDATGLSKGDALDDALEKMFGDTKDLPIPYDQVVAAHPGYSLYIMTYVDYDFIVLDHPKITGLARALIVVGIPSGITSIVNYEGKCSEGGYVAFKRLKRSLNRGELLTSKPPVTDQEAQMRREVLEAEIERNIAAEAKLRKERAELERRKAALPGD